MTESAWISLRMKKGEIHQINEVCKEIGISRSLWVRRLMAKELAKEENLRDGSNDERIDGI